MNLRQTRANRLSISDGTRTSDGTVSRDSSALKESNDLGKTGGASVPSAEPSTAAQSEVLGGQRRKFIKLSATAVLSSGVLPGLADESKASQVLRFGLIADLHQDLIPDAPARLEAFLEASASQDLDALIQLGDFATPIAKNRAVIDAFNAAHPQAWHVIGNHDTDGGVPVAQVVDVWGMTGRYYSRELQGVKFIVLDCNERPENHSSGYPAHIGDVQLEWLSGELLHPGPIVVLSHQPLAGPSSIDNAELVRTRLATASDRILLAMNGHTHIDELLEIDSVNYWHVNSAAYYWVGGTYKHESLSSEVHDRYPAMASTCPYQAPLFAFMEIDLAAGTISIRGKKSSWIGKDPRALGFPSVPSLEPGKQIVPEIRDRQVEKRA